ESRFKKKEGAESNNNYKSGSSTTYNVMTKRSNELVEYPSENHHDLKYSGQTGQGTQSGACIFTQSQYDQIVHLLNQAQASTSAIPGSSTNATANAVGKNESGIRYNKALLVAKILKDWITDIEATNHMVVDTQF
ncbi:hypothetical protein HAX54_050058, partial [Datura stramonium]|nr:hypothetical protein [Datura stramonium]